MATTDPQRRNRGELEAGVLAVLWAAEKALTPGDVQRALPGDLARTTVNTILARLHDKGVLVRARSGRAFVYAPAHEAQDAPGLAARRMRSELEKGVDRQTVLTRFVSGLNQDDEDLLRELLKAGQPEAPPTDEAEAENEDESESDGNGNGTAP